MSNITCSECGATKPLAEIGVKPEESIDNIAICETCCDKMVADEEAEYEAQREACITRIQSAIVNLGMPIDDRPTCTSLYSLPMLQTLANYYESLIGTNQTPAISF